MGNSRNTGFLQNAVKVADNGDISLMHGNTMLMQISSSGAITTTGVISGSNALSASYAATSNSASYALSSTSASYAVASTSASYAASATSASYAVNSTTASYADALTVAGTLTAQTLVVQTITSSVDFVTGSTRFGSILGNTHVFSGSVTMNPNGLFVSSSGAIGIGTTTPTSLLHIKGANARIRLTGDTHTSIEIEDGGTGDPGYIRTYNNGSAVCQIGAGDGGTYFNTGNIGIGTSNPNAYLSGTKGLSIVDTTNAALGLSNGTNLWLNYLSGTSYRIWNNSNSEVMTFLLNGKVGIGTTNPGYKLTVVTDSTAALLVQASSATVGSPIVDFYDNGRNQETVITSTDGSTTGTYIASYSNHPLLFGTNAGGSPTAKMVIAANGNVGMGTSSPTSLLHIGTSTSGNQKLTHWGEPGFTANYGLILRGDSSDGVFKFFGLNNGSESGSPLFSMNRASANSAFGTTSASTYSRLNINGSTKINRSIYNWYQGYWTGNSTYWHMKTNMWAGGSPNGNTQYTMSYFKGYMYSYSDSILEGAAGFHNWDGTIYAYKTTGNLFSNVYRSSDGYVVLVIPSGAGETGVTIDWHQAYAYPFVEAQVTAAKLHGATTGGY